MNRRLKAFIYISIALLGFAPVQAQTPRAEALKLEILLKLFSQNKNLALSEIDTVNLAIFYDPANAAAVEKAEQYENLITSATKMPFKGKPVRVNTLSAEEVASANWDTFRGVVVIPGERINLSSMLQHCAENQTLSMAADSTMSGQGISIAVDMNDEQQPEIWFNATSLNNEGASYEREILQLVQHLRF